MASEGFKRTLMSALGWSAAIKVGFQLLSWCMTLLVIRLLAPEDYGLMAISQVFIGFCLSFSTLGLGDALVQRQDTPRHLVASVFGVLLLVGGAATVLLALAAYPLAGWYHEPRLVRLIQLSSLGFLFNAMVVPPRAALSKRMRLREIFIADLSSGVVGAVSVLVLALSGFGVWALALGALVSNVVRQAAFFAVGRRFYVWPRLDFGAVRPLLGFGAYTTLEYIAWMVMTTADVLIVGAVLGTTATGIYTVVLNFAAMPLSKIAPVISSVAFPAFSMLQHDRLEARRYMHKALDLMAALVVPVFLGVAVTAPEIVRLVFGPSWDAARPLLPILSVALIFRAMLIIAPNYLQGIGDAKASFWCTAAGAVLVPLAVWIGSGWGLVGACWGWVVAYPVIFCIAARILSHRGGLAFSAIVQGLGRAFCGGAVMAVCVAGLGMVLPPGFGVAARLACLVPLGAAVYACVMAAIFPALIQDVRRMWSEHRRPA